MTKRERGHDPLGVVDVLIPVLHRPQNVVPFMKSLRATAPQAVAWFICDPDDELEQAVAVANGGRVLECAGTFAQKANFAWRALDRHAEWTFLVGDDVRFHDGWFERATGHARACGLLVCGTNDLTNWRVLRGEHATHLLLSSEYITRLGASWDGPGIICHDGYRHWYVDNEIVVVAKQRGVFGVALDAVVEHLHPHAGKAPHDAVYALGELQRDADRQLFKRRLRTYSGMSFRQRLHELGTLRRTSATVRRWRRVCRRPLASLRAVVRRRVDRSGRGHS